MKYEATNYASGTLIMKTQIASETLVFNQTLTQLIVPDNFIAFIHREIVKSCIIITQFSPSSCCPFFSFISKCLQSGFFLKNEMYNYCFICFN
jgi:ABC-type transport system involved in Fe-S cluster assembly fused permease/ATPase subunit